MRKFLIVTLAALAALTAALTVALTVAREGDTAVEVGNGVVLKLRKIPGEDCLIGITEVTQAQYESVCGENPSYFKGADLPVEMVTWDDAMAFCAKLNEKFPQKGYKWRLPTVKVWETAARGGQAFKYAGSDDIGEVAWHYGNSGDHTHPVGQKKPNGYGLYDMSGNVWEWCEDSDGDGDHNIRGGGWFYYAEGCGVGFSCWDCPDYRHFSLGFRVCLVAECKEAFLTRKKASAPADKLVPLKGDTAVEVGNGVVLKLRKIPGEDCLIGITEVTQAQYESVCGENPSEFKGADLPVEMVTWYDAMAFCATLNEKFPQKGYKWRLPTEELWEIAARGGQAFKYAGSDDIGEVAWFRDNSGGHTHPVGQKKPNGYGLYDMSGNVWEWCLDSFDRGSRIDRGGSWYSGAGGCEVDNRGCSCPFDRSGDLGFRVCLVPSSGN